MALQQLLDSMTRLELPLGAQVFEEGDEVNAMYVVECGELSVSKRLLQEDEQEIQAATLGPGSYIGELGLFHRRVSRESVRVTGDAPATVWRLNRAEFNTVIGGLAQDETPQEACDIDFDDLESSLGQLGESDVEIFSVSDGSGYSAAGAVQLALKQFEYNFRDTCKGVNVTTFPFIRYEAEVLEITRRAREENALIVYTLMRDEPRRAMSAEVQRPLKDGENELRTVDLWEPMLAQMESVLGIPRQSRVSMSALRPSLSDTCLKMVEAIEFTRLLDDGVHPERWKDADVVLIGLSRAGKTPLSIFLAQRGFKVANYPVVPDEEPPKELFDPAVQSKCIALAIEPDRLSRIRQERMLDFRRSTSTYSSLQNCTKETRWLKTFCMRHGPRWPRIDTTSGALEEQAAKIIKLLAARAGEASSSPSYANPSVA